MLRTGVTQLIPAYRKGAVVKVFADEVQQNIKKRHTQLDKLTVDWEMPAMS